MTKKEFMERIKCFGQPVLRFNTDDSYLYLNTYFTVFDKKNFRNKFQAGYVRLTRYEYYNGDFSRYYERERKTKEKFTRWLGGKK